MGNEFATFEDMLQIEGARQDLLINGGVFVAAASEAQATDLAELLRRLKKVRLEDRSAEIERELAWRLDADRACSRLKEYGDKAFELGLDSLILFFVTFILSPVVVRRWGLAVAWPFLLFYLILNVFLIVWDFRRADRALFPSSNVSRWNPIATMALSPPAAMHATKYLARDLGRDCHPLAFAAARCSDDDFRTLASRALREAMFMPETSSGMDEQAADCAEWFRQRLQDSVSVLVRKKGYDPQALIAPPPRESERVRSYCPRCLSQFVISEGLCTDCGGVSLCSFDGTPCSGHEQDKNPHGVGQEP